LYLSKKQSNKKNLLFLIRYHFLIENRLASGATWQSSGQVSHIQNTFIETHFTQYSRQLYERLHKEGHDIGKKFKIKIFN
jgi:hypothetical protein